MTKNLRQKTMHGLFWSFLERFSLQGVQFGIGILLARILAPDQFGLIAMLTVFTQLGGVILDSGFGQALIRKKEITQTDICSIFYFNIAISVIICLIICAASPFIAMYFKQPILQPLVCVLSLQFIFNSFGLIHRMLLRRKVDFKSQFKVGFPCVIISGAAGVVAAYCGLGVWALVIQILIASISTSVLFWVVDKWRPTLTFSFESLKEMFGFGSKLLVSGIINVIFNNAYIVVIGRLFDATALGFYSRAFKLQSFPSMNVAIIVNQVAYPVFSHIHDEPERLLRGMKKAVKTLILINAPVMVGLAAVAEPLIVTLIKAKWLPCVPYLRLLCFVGLLLPFHMINLSVIQALGRSDIFLRLEIIKRSLTVVNIFITYRFGIMSMLQGQLVVTFVGFLLNAHYGGKTMNYTPLKQIRDMIPYILATVPMAGVCYFISLSHQSDVLILIRQIIAGVAVWLLTCRLVRLEAFMEFWPRAIKIIENILLKKRGDRRLA